MAKTTYSYDKKKKQIKINWSLVIIYYDIAILDGVAAIQESHCVHFSFTSTSLILFLWSPFPRKLISKITSAQWCVISITHIAKGK